MEVRCRPAVLCCVFAILLSVVPRSLESSLGDRQYLNEWAVEIPGGLAAAEAIAKELDYKLVRQVGTRVPGAPQKQRNRKKNSKMRCKWILFIRCGIKANCDLNIVSF